MIHLPEGYSVTETTNEDGGLVEFESEEGLPTITLSDASGEWRMVTGTGQISMDSNEATRYASAIAAAVIQMVGLNAGVSL